jgi:hypothetical protein
VSIEHQCTVSSSKADEVVTFYPPDNGTAAPDPADDEPLTIEGSS